MPTVPSSQPEPFATDDRDLASYLLAKGIELVGSGTNGRYSVFFFSTEHDLETSRLEFVNNASIPVLDFLRAQTTIKSIIRKTEQSQGEERK